MKPDAKSLMAQIKTIGLLLLLVATSWYSNAQVPVEDDEIDMLLDELFFNEEEFINDILASLNRYDFIYTSFSLNSNTYFSGRDSGIDQYNFYPQISYYHSSGFNISLSGLYYEKFDPNWDLTSISVGYDHYLNKKRQWYFSSSYTRYFYSDGSDVFTNSINLGIGIQNKKRTLGSSVSASYLFGSDNALQLVSSTYGNFTLHKEKAFSIKFRPRLNILVAEQTIALEELNSLTQESEFYIYDVFNLLNTQLSLPISLVGKKFNMDLGYTINFPNPVAAETNLDSTGFFSISMGYLIGL